MAAVHTYTLSRLLLYVHVLHWIFFLILELNRLIVALDAAAEKALSSSDSFTPERKKRIIADIPSPLKPPPDAPGWAIKPDCMQNYTVKGME